MKNSESLFEPVEKKTAVDFVIEGFKASFLEGRLFLNDTLPNEVVLAKQFGVGRSTIREALKKLESYGVLQTQSTKGTIVVSNFSEAYSRLWSLNLLLGLKANVYEDIQRFRQMIEVGNILQIQIEKVNIEALTKINDKLLLKNAPVKELASIDYQFHRMLLGIVGNEMAIQTFENLRILLEKILTAAKNTNKVKDTWQDHANIIHMLQQGDTQKASRILYNHLEKGINILKEQCQEDTTKK